MSELAECVETLWGFMKFIFKQILKVSAFYLEKKVLFLKKIFLSRFQYQNKKALFTGAIFPKVLMKSNHSNSYLIKELLEAFEKNKASNKDFIS